MGALARMSVLKDGLLLNIAAGTTTWDKSFKALLIASTKQVENHCMRQLVSASVADEKIIGGSGVVDGNILYPKEYPVTGITSVSFWNGTAYTAESTTYFELIDGKEIFYPTLTQVANSTYNQWPIRSDGAYNIKLTYVAGYDTTGWDDESAQDIDSTTFGVPADLEEAVAKLAAIRWLDGRESGQARLGQTSVTTGDETIRFAKLKDGLPDEVRDILKNYVRPSY